MTQEDISTTIAYKVLEKLKVKEEKEAQNKMYNDVIKELDKTIEDLSTKLIYGDKDLFTDTEKNKA